MSKTKIEEKVLFDNFDNRQSPMVKKLRFHPYYYQGRKCSYYNSEGKRFNVKIVKVEKNDDDLILTIAGKSAENRLELQSLWENVEFDYYSIHCSQNWILKFSKKF